VIVLEVIDAQRTRLQTERARLQTLNQQMTTSVLLIKALGGGWTGAVPSAAGTPRASGPGGHAWN
jgi:multidrug efflux system outer membrane protein